MPKFIVIKCNPGGGSQGIGEHEFEVSPRVGEHIDMNDADDIGQTYEVVSVIHPLDKATNAGDLIIRHVANSTEFRRSLEC